MTDDANHPHSLATLKAHFWGDRDEVDELRLWHSQGLTANDLLFKDPNSGDLITGDGEPAGMDTSLEVITQVDLASAAASIDLTSIPADYQGLVLRGSVQSAAAANSDELRMTVNGDSGTNYNRQRLRALGASASSTGATGQTYIDLALMSAGNSAAGYFTPIEVVLPDYAGDAFKNLLSRGMLNRESGVGSMGLDLVAGTWTNAAAITQLTLIAAAGNLAAGSVLTLYGARGA